MHTPLEYKRACSSDAAECIAVRGLTRQNAISVSQLALRGITADSWSESIQSNEQIGFLCLSQSRIIGYCFGDLIIGEIVVLALLPEFENRGIGRSLLGRVVTELSRSGETNVFLGCSADPESRSYGFYRHLGWKTTSQYDSYGDEILEYHSAANGEA